MSNLKNKNASNRNIVRNILVSTVAELQRVVEPHFVESGFIRNTGAPREEREYLRICVFEHDENDEPVIFTNEELNLTIEGFTEDGVITDSWIGIATINYKDLMFEQASWALDIALDYYGKE